MEIEHLSDLNSSWIEFNVTSSMIEESEDENEKLFVRKKNVVVKKVTPSDQKTFFLHLKRFCLLVRSYAVASHESVRF